MDLRFCPRCRADVEDAGGFCLLGHRLPTTTTDPIADLRVEVNKAFEKVQVEVTQKVADDKVSEPVENPTDIPVWQQLRGDDREMAEEMRATSRKVYEELSLDEEVSRTDPIIAFSPSPRADWGPEKGHGKRSRR